MNEKRHNKRTTPKINFSSRLVANKAKAQECFAAGIFYRKVYCQHTKISEW